MSDTIADSVLRPFSILEALRPSQEYRELEKKREEIRIAELYPKEFREKTRRQYVSCYIQTASFRDFPSSFEPYTALSYTWGDPRKRVPIHLDNRLVQVTENLSEALQNFEQNHLALRIWIDAICINQADETEKSQQVEMMAEIYKRASEVLVWLGPSEDGSKEALEVFKRIGNEALLLHGKRQHTDGDANNHNRKEPADKDMFDAIRSKWFPDGVPSFDLRLTQKVLQRSWFRRVWVLQEAALNENVTFYCGKQSISKRVLWAGARTIIALTNEISTHSRASINDLPVWQTLSGTNFITRRTLHLVKSARKKLPLETLLTEITTNLGEWPYEATDPRDRVFAILGLSSDSTALNIRSDYKKTCKVVYTEVAESILTQSRTLDILYAVSGPKNVKPMPSWVPDWSVPIQSTFGPRQLGRFSASGPLSRSFPTFRSDKFGNRLLVLSGYKVDTIDAIMHWQWDPRWDVGFDLNSPILGFIRSLQNFGRKQRAAYSSEEERQEALWRTPIADCDAAFNIMQGSRPPASLHMKESFEAFIGITQGDPEWRERASKPYVHVMKLESARRRVFRSSRGYYGLGQETLRVGDTICLFLGGDSPFLIRNAELGYYELIGEAYVHGIMHGEYLSTNPHIEQFILC
jgi:Heterokaryon incompatibility protein (HET)